MLLSLRLLVLLVMLGYGRIQPEGVVLVTLVTERRPVIILAVDTVVIPIPLLDER